VWTDSWLSIAGEGCGLIGVGAGEEQTQKVYASWPPGVEKTSRLDSRDPVASEIKCVSQCGKNNQTTSYMVPWLILKAKIESGRRGGQVMSEDWWEATPSP
jgi:hypothetical protein